MMNYLSPRPLYGAGLILCVASMAFAYFFLEQHLGLEPCPLCLIDRGLVILIGLFFLLGLLHNPVRLGRYLYGSGALITSLAGVAVCWRHLWLQNLPKDQVPECSPGLDYMLEVLPLGEVIQMIFNSAGECADLQWSFLGLSIPAQTLLVFLALATISGLILWRNPQSS